MTNAIIFVILGISAIVYLAPLWEIPPDQEPYTPQVQYDDEPMAGYPAMEEHYEH